MKNLAYIPTKIDKHKIYAQIQQQQYAQDDQEQVEDPGASQKQMDGKKKLSRQEVALLLQRLTHNTKKEYNTEQQTTHILAANLEIKKRREQGDKVENRLIDYGKKIQEKKEELAKQIQAENKQKYYRDAPEISNKAKNLHQKAIDKRLDQLIQKKMSKRQELIERYQPKFHPVINPQSDFINDLENYGDLHNRMEAKQKDAIKRRQSLVKCIQQKKKQEYTFKPMINTNSKNIAENLTDRKALSVTTPVVKKQPQTAKQINRQIYPFAPTINKNTDNFLNKKGDNFDSDCFRRLYKNAKDMLTKHQQKVQQRSRAYTFQPEINARSLKIANSVKKKSKQETANQFSDKESEDQYQQIKIGISGNDYSRKKAYSVKAANDSKKDWQDDFKQKYINVVHRSGKINTNLIR